MPSYKERLTWPCGMQRSYEGSGWNLEVKEDNDKPIPCPLHGLDCHRGA